MLEWKGWKTNKFPCSLKSLCRRDTPTPKTNPTIPLPFLSAPFPPTSCCMSWVHPISLRMKFPPFVSSVLVHSNRGWVGGWLGLSAHPVTYPRSIAHGTLINADWPGPWPDQMTHGVPDLGPGAQTHPPTPTGLWLLGSLSRDPGYFRVLKVGSHQQL